MMPVEGKMMKNPSTDRLMWINPVIVLLAFLMSVSVAIADAENSVEYAEADSFEEHRLAADYYHGRALEAESDAQAHDELLLRYEKAGLTIVARHCRAIAERFSEIASQYQLMAAEHTRMAETLADRP